MNRDKESLLLELRSFPGNKEILELLADMEEDSGDSKKALSIRDSAAIASRIRKLREDIEELAETYKNNIRALNGLILNNQKMCQHIYTEREPDYSGNNDVTITCLCCGRMLR